MKSLYATIAIVSLGFVFFDARPDRIDSKVNVTFLNGNRHTVQVRMEGIKLEPFLIKPYSSHKLQLPFYPREGERGSTLNTTILPTYTQVSIPADPATKRAEVAVESKMLSSFDALKKTNTFAILIDPRPQFGPRLTIGPWVGGQR